MDCAPMYGSDSWDIGFCEVCHTLQDIAVGHSVCLLCQLVEDNVETVAPSALAHDQTGAEILRSLQDRPYTPVDYIERPPTPKVPTVTAVPDEEEAQSERAAQEDLRCAFERPPGANPLSHTPEKRPRELGIPPELRGKVVRLVRHPVPDPPAAGESLLQLAAEYKEKGDVVGECACLLRAAGHSEGNNKDGNVYKYSRYIAHIMNGSLSTREKLIADESYEEVRTACVNAAKAASKNSTPAHRVYKNYMRAYTLYVHLCSSLY